MINEYGEEISDEQKKEIAERILKLSDEAIDEFWFRCGLKYIPPGENFRALDIEILSEIKNNKENSRTIWELLAETPLKDILENLDKIEKEARLT